MDLADRISKLSPQQRKLVELKLKQQRADIDVLHIPITREDRKDSKRFPLSFAQERLWFIDQIAPGNPAYNIVRATKLEGHLDIIALGKSINEMINRHEILRTTFIFDNQKPKQVILPGLSIPLAHIDLKGLAEENQVSGIKQVKERESLYSFDLAKGPLLRTHLLALSPYEHIFLLVIHHIISDGISTEIFIRQLIRLYQAFSQGKAPALPALSLQYADYACWQRRWFEENAAYTTFRKKQEEYWVNEFSGEIPVLALPIDYPRPVMQSFEGDIIYFKPGIEEQKALNEMASREKTTLFVVLLAVYTIFLSKLSGMEDIVVGTPAAGRRYTALQDMIGMFVNTLPLRNYPGADKRFGDFLAEVKTRTLKAFENQDYRYEDIVEKVEVTRDTGRNPLFDAAFLLQNQEAAKLEIPGLRLSPLPYEPKTSKFDLSFEVIETGDNLRFSFEYCTKLFEEETIKRFSRYFTNVVSVVVADPGIRLSDIEIFGEEEKHQLLFEFNRAAVSYPRDKTIHKLFQEQVERTPDRIAVFGSVRTGSIAYRELDKQSDGLAHLLRARGVEAGTIAGIMMERSIEMMVGLFAILKAGGAYLPIGPHYPEERINYMLADSSAKILLTDSLSEGRHFNCQLFIVNCLLFMGSLECPLHHPGNLAYVIYTSGSTGKPKGVMIEHRSLVNRLNWMQKAYPIGARDVILQKTTTTFDVSVWELFWWSMTGASLCLLEPGGEKNPAVIIETIERGSVTTMHFVPSMLNAFLEFLDMVDTRLESLRQVFSSGEALMPHHVNKFDRLLYETGGTKLINLYGPTEATIDVSYYNCWDMELRDTIPIGKPINNTQLVVMDKGLRLQGIGIAGELCIAGDGLARGYLNRPDLTNSKFQIPNYKQIPNTKSQIPNSPTHPLTHSPLYRTGDLARWLSDGNIEFLGRIDHQVKIRGFRIELGEIEDRLLAHENVKEAVVVDREDKEGDKYLCAYIVTGGPVTAIDTKLRQYLSQILPDYMIPAHFIELEYIPLTPNGKVDRKTLPGPSLAQPGEGYLPPGNPVEEALVYAWQEVLGVERIGINDHFFQLGGDSIKAIQVAAALRKHGLDMSINDLFLHPVIKRLQGLVKVIRRVIPQDPVEGEVPLTPIQRWFFDSHPVHRHHFNQAVLLYKEAGFDEAFIEIVFTRILEHHDALRMVVEDEGTAVALRNKGIEGKFFHLEVIDLRGTNGRDIGKVIEREAGRLQAGIDLQTGPLVKLGLFKTAGGDHLLIAVHHLVIDGVSWRILLEDLAAGFESVRQGEAITFQAKTDSFRLWAQKLNQYAHGAADVQNKELSKELDYWKTVESLPVEPLPRDRQIGIEKKKNRYSGTVTVELNPGETENLLKHTNAAFNTEVNDILLTALGLAFREWSGQEQVLVNLEGHGRETILEDVDISRTVGWFTSLYPVRLDLAGVNGLSHAVKKVKETLRDIPRHGIGYGILRYLVPPEKKQGCSFDLEPEILFNYLGQFDLEMSRGEWFRVSPLKTGKTVSPDAPRTHTFEIDGMLVENRLRLSFTYNAFEYERRNIEALGSCYRSHLVAVIRHCTAAGDKRLGCTPSDFPLAVTGQQRLDLLFEKYTGAGIEIEDIYALSPSQQSMIFHHLYTPDSSVTVEHQLFVIRWELDIEAFRAAWQALLDRHASLRASFHWQGLDELIQVIHKNVRVPFELEDQQDIPTAQQETRFARFLESDRRRGFDLSGPPLMRVFVFRLEKSFYRVVWTYHHLLLDGWCRGILMREIVHLYDAYSCGKDSQLEPIPPFKDYIRWLKEQDSEKAEVFWRDYLKGFNAPILISKNLPYRSEPGETRPYGEIRHEYSPEETQQFMGLSKRQKITLNSLVQGAWALLLSHYSGEEDIVFGATVSGRPPRLDGALTMIGCFMNTVPMRVQVNPSTDVTSWLQEIQLNHSRVRQYEHSSLADIRSYSQVPRVSALYDLYETIVVFENYPFDMGQEAHRLGSTSDQLDEQMDYPLTLYIIPGVRLTFKLLFDTRFFNEPVVEQLMQHLVYLLDSFRGCAACRPGEIPMVPGEEARRLIEDWNDTTMEYPAAKTIVQLLEEQVAAAPHQLAAVFDDIHLTYRQLNKKANRLAWTLREKGVRPNRFVALRMDRSMEMVVGILGILKAGGAYIPISTDVPEERAAFMLKDSGTDILLTRDRLEVFSRGSEKNPGITAGPQDLAYVMYTSGTTGLPKGVMVEHRNVVNLLTWFGRRYHLGKRRHVMQLSEYVFDPSVEQILGTLAYGSTVYMIRRELLIDAGGFRRFVETRQVDMINFVPEALKELLLSRETRINGLQTVISGGDRLENSIKDGIIRRGYQLYNHYGPTEITVDALTSECSEEKVNLGKPIANTRVYILDRRFRLLPIGVPGELCIAGPGVARGYLNDPPLTNSKFQRGWQQQPHLTHPLTHSPIYRTGDLARWRGDGNIEFLGRVDQQVKVRGLRVEPGEIESHLLAIEGINEAVVLLKTNEKGDKYLCAYFSAAKPFGVSELKDCLINKIPFYMVPTGFIQLERLPLNPNGKVDIHALPEPQLQAEEDHAAPANEMEKQLAALWAETLGLDEAVIGANSNFFQLGGHSLSAMRAVSKIQEVFHVKIPLSSFFQLGTIRGIAGIIAAKQPGDRRSRFSRRNGLIRPFELHQAPLVRTSLVKLQDKRWFFFIDMHHIIADGISLDIIADEFITLYEGGQLDALPIQYKDFSYWQKGFFENERFRRQETYWLEVFSVEPRRLNLPLDYPRPEVRKGEGKVAAFQVGSELSTRLKRLAAEQEVTLFMLLLAAYTILLAKYTGREDIIVGTPVSGRTHVNTGQLVGMFVNTLALRHKPSGRLTFYQFLQRVKEQTLSDLANQDYPFEMLVEKLNLSGDAGGNPLFDTMFTVEYDRQEKKDNMFTPYQLESTAALFDLVLGAAVSDEDIRLGFSYDIHLFHEDTIERLAGFFINILSWTVQAPEQPIEKIDMSAHPSAGLQIEPGRETLTGQDRDWILYEFNDTRMDYPADKTIHQLFEEQVEQTPDRIAIHMTHMTYMTYKELNKKADQLADLLLKKGISANDCAAVMVERSIEMMVALLGILKAGACYLPLEPAYPADRKQYMLKDSGAKILLTNNSLSEGRQFNCQLSIVNCQLFMIGEAQPAAAISNPQPAASLAYIIYTSGSTGRPKGTVVEHRAVVNRLVWMQQAYPLAAEDSILQKTTITFDVSVLELFGWFPGGARLCFLEPGAEKDMQKIRQSIETHHITAVSFTPTVLHTFLLSIGKKDAMKLCSLKWIFCAGEQLPKALVEVFADLALPAKLENLYGPTEGVVYVSYYTCNSHCPAPVPIGKPLGNTRLYVLDEHGELLPRGAVGELCIAGDCLSRGYLNHPDLSAERFVPDPFYPGERMYRTGDYAKLLPEGEVVYLGRMDSQVKIRGFRIELGEIEAVLREHPDIKEAAVIDREDPQGIKYLAAYIVTQTKVTLKEMQTHLLKKLPGFMVPAAIFKIEKIPLSDSGKLDRRALRQMETINTSLETGVQYTAPGTESERQLTRCWADILKKDKIGMDDNFFEMGGDSLRANLLLAKINNRFHTAAVLKDLFNAPTIRRFAETLPGSKAEGEAVIEAVEKKEYYPASSSQKRLFVIQQLNSEDTGYNLPMGMKIEGPLDSRRLKNTVKQLVLRHESLRTGFVMEKDEIVQKIEENPEVEVEFFELEKKQLEKIDIKKIVKGDIPLRSVSKEMEDNLLSSEKLKKVKRKRKEI